jgi:hypothetical protein
MPDAWNAVKIRDFEHVLAAPTVTLLRVSGKPPRRRSTVGPRPVLVANDGQTIRRFAAIPSPPDDRGVLRAAYSVSSDLLAPSTTFSLELTDGTVVALPAPQPGNARPAPEPADDPASELGDAHELPEGTDERRSGLVTKLTELSARLAESEQARDELEQTAAPLNATIERTELELVGARERAARAEAEATKSAAALEELETWRGELERRLTETTDELTAAKAARTEDQAEVLRLGGELAEAKANAELLQAQVQALGDRLAEAVAAVDAGSYSPSERERITRQVSQLAALLESTDRLSDLAAELAEARAQAEILHAAASAEPPPWSAALPATDDELVAARREIEELRAQLAQAGNGQPEAPIEAIARAAEAEARELAERELA